MSHYLHIYISPQRYEYQKLLTNKRVVLWWKVVKLVEIKKVAKLVCCLLSTLLIQLGGTVGLAARTCLVLPAGERWSKQIPKQSLFWVNTLSMVKWKFSIAERNGLSDQIQSISSHVHKKTSRSRPFEKEKILYIQITQLVIKIMRFFKVIFTDKTEQAWQTR